MRARCEAAERDLKEYVTQAEAKARQQSEVAARQIDELR